MPGTFRFRLSAAAPRVAEGEAWWSQAGSNRRPLACHASALPAELWPLNLHFSMIPGKRFAFVPKENRIPLFRITLSARLGRRAGKNPEHSSGLISSLFVAADVANNVGDVLVAFFFIGDEGRIIIVVVFDRFVDLDIVFRFGNDSLDLAGVLLGVGFLKRHQFFGLGGLR